MLNRVDPVLSLFRLNASASDSVEEISDDGGDDEIFLTFLAPTHPRI